MNGYMHEQTEMHPLIRQGYDLDLAFNITEALARLKTASIDTVIVDGMMSAGDNKLWQSVPDHELIAKFVETLIERSNASRLVSVLEARKVIVLLANNEQLKNRLHAVNPDIKIFDTRELVGANVKGYLGKVFGNN